MRPCHKSALIAPLLVSILLLGCGSGPKASIERVLREDKEIGMQIVGQQGKVTNEVLDRVADNIQQAAHKMKRIDLSGCPPDFAEAYFAHAKAWYEFGEVTRDHPNIPTTLEGLVGGFINGLMGDPTGGAFRVQAEIGGWQERARLAYKEVNATYNKVEEIAVRYGARLP